MGAYDKYNSLNPQEQDFVVWHPFAAWEFEKAANTALDEAGRRYPTSLHNGRGDAFRHAYWNALMEDAELAKAFANAHEETPGQPGSEKTMDLHHNEVGREIGLVHRRSSDAEIAIAVESALKSGRLKWLIPLPLEIRV